MLKKFFSYYKPHRRLFIIDFTSAVIVAILELAFPVAVRWFVDDLLPGNNWDHIIIDRKSTRLNSSHVAISYAVFCLKKKIRFVKQHRHDAMHSLANDADDSTTE